ncbi:MAG: hypothetical protein J2P36_24160 [Ktedonobacteraceae bacterium]|nr:hypothetical protein [Ktedonobacteraceae bacterium]
MQKNNITLPDPRSVVLQQGLLFGNAAFFGSVAFFVYLLYAAVVMSLLIPGLSEVYAIPSPINMVIFICSLIMHIVLVTTLFFFAGRAVVRRTRSVKMALQAGLLMSVIYGLSAYWMNDMLISLLNTYVNCGTFFPRAHQLCTLVGVIPFPLIIMRLVILLEALLLGWLMSWLGGWVEIRQRAPVLR